MEADKPPIFVDKLLPSGSRLIRFSSLQDIYYYDELRNNPRGLGFRAHSHSEMEDYKHYRSIITEPKQKIIERAQREMSLDKDFLGLVYKGKSQKRRFEMNKFVGNLSMPQFAMQSDKMFKKGVPGAKKQTLSLAFQVGTFVGGNYTESFIKVLKTIMMCQAMNISVNIDMFDSDTSAIGGRASYVIACVAKSSEKINFKAILAASHDAFFNFTLFNGYSASGCQDHIGTFLNESRITTDLSPIYDVIGGNMLQEHAEGENKDLVNKILKIGLR